MPDTLKQCKCPYCGGAWTGCDNLRAPSPEVERLVERFEEFIGPAASCHDCGVSYRCDNHAVLAAYKEAQR